MLKWLRKYNTFILVVGGCLLMVAFLLQGVLTDLSKHGLFGGAAFKIGSKKVGLEEFTQAGYEYYGMGKVVETAGAVIGRRIGLAAVGGGENAEHWYLLSREAQQAGLVGGKRDGEDYLDELATAFASQIAQQQSDLELYRTIFKGSMDKAFDQCAAEAHLTPDQLYQAFGKLRGAVRLQNAYTGSARYSSRRLITTSRASTDTVVADYVLIPAERELADIPEPSEQDIQQHFAKFRDTPKGGGDFGIGYKLPARVKVEWLELNRDIIAGAVAVDAVEVEKRFLAKYPDGKVPEGKSAAGERNTIENEVRKELTDKVMKTAEQVVRSEIDKPLRKLDRDVDYYKLPADWTARRPDFQKIRELVAARLLEQHKILIPAPKIVIRANEWIYQEDVRFLEGLGGASVRRPNGSRMAQTLLFGVHEIDENGEVAYQVGVPFPETLENASGNRYFFNILDARKESPPDSIDEVRADIVKNIKRLQAYEKLKAKEASLRAAAVAEGLEAVAKPPAGTTLSTIPILQFSVSKERSVVGQDPLARALDTQPFRDAVVAQTAALDPLTDFTKADAAAKTFSTPVNKALGICIYRVKQLLPLTVERFRSQQNSLARDAARAEIGANLENTPFSYDEMKKRLKVTDAEGREMKDKRSKQ